MNSRNTPTSPSSQARERRRVALRRLAGADARCRESFACNRLWWAYISDGTFDCQPHKRPTRDDSCRTPGRCESHRGFARRRQRRRRGNVMQIDVPDALLDALADRLAPKVADRLAVSRPPFVSPWMTFEELATYTKIAKGTLRKLGAEGTFKAYGGKRKLYHREEVDAALLGLSHAPRLSRPIVLRRAS
jgi:hypothetical protein